MEADMNKTTSYSIEKSGVNKEAFFDLLNSLQKVKHSSFYTVLLSKCFDTNISRFELISKSGAMISYTQTNSPNSIKESIRKTPDLRYRISTAV
jgi:hypothetical protein